MSDYKTFCDAMKRGGKWPLSKRKIYEEAYRVGFEEGTSRLNKAVAHVHAEAIESVLENCESLEGGRVYLNGDIEEYAEAVRQGEVMV